MATGKDDDEESEDEEEERISTKRTKVSLIHINCQSLKNKIAKLELEAEDHDVVLLSETWLHKDIENEDIALEGFDNLVRNSKNNN